MIKLILTIVATLLISFNAYADDGLYRALYLEDSSVRIQNMYEEPICSGVVITNSEKGAMVLTARHCIQNGLRIKGSIVKLYLVFSNNDLAILGIDEKLINKEPIKMAQQDPVIGEQVYSYGYPSGQIAFGDGKIILSEYSANIKRGRSTWVFSRLSKISIGVSPGNSGGGVYNSSNELIGISVVSNGLTTGIVPISEIKNFIIDLAKNK